MSSEIDTIQFNFFLKKIPKFILHADHMGDMLVLAQEMPIGEVLVSQGSLTKTDFVAKLQVMKTKVRALQVGDMLPIMGSRLQVLYPHDVGDGGNNDSMVLYGQLLGKRFLFTGDLEKEGEQDLMATYSHLPVDVLKFLAHISPQMALISAGEKNRYKHPHQETLERFNQQGLRIYRTDQEGAIRFRGLTHWQIETVR